MLNASQMLSVRQVAVPWIRTLHLTECDRYRLLRSYFVQTKHWKAHDPFQAQKQETFKKSSKAIFRALPFVFSTYM